MAGAEEAHPEPTPQLGGPIDHAGRKVDAERVAGLPEEPWPVAGIVRAARRRAGASQRELGRRAGVHHATIGRIEAGGLTPSLDLLQRIIAVAGFRLAVVDECGRVLQPMRDWDDTRDGAGRRYPSHLDTILDPGPGEWWADIYGLGPPTGDLPPRPSGPGGPASSQPVGGACGPVPRSAATAGPPLPPLTA
ncbi:helix-turn-helix domain-containing protein [Micromonospora sagamiensis]|uniref:DNA-binding XRE family transcriptional regulator n=1 Tax=Micromonospora sagamiensis TaxID=47875 RepID=A0A562W9I1_9ACTN|nr:helix-turn-helix transcriptional regulator [Micromonospora sagamiensis]TWJ26953.1 DNA-binding XRE family transcriptional regulator [Micromonospora sagamiensis]